MGDHSRGTHQLPHLWPLILTLTSAQNPCFYQKIVTQSPVFFHTVQNFGNCSLKDPKSAGKKVPKCPLFLWLLSLKDPQFFALHASVWGECCSLKHGQKLENFVFLRQNRAIWWILLDANLIKVMKTRFQFYRLNRSNCYGITSLEGRDDTQVIISWSNTEGDISYKHPLYDSAPPGSLSKCQVYLKLCEQRHFKCKVQWWRARWRARENFEI